MELSWTNKLGENKLLSIYALIVLVSIFSAIATEMYFLAGIPLAVLLIYISILDFKYTFFLLALCLPISSEVDLVGGFGTDLPSEPLMVGLMMIFLLYSLKNGDRLSANFMKHPLTILIFLHLGWIVLTTITSNLFFVSLKFLLAKTWYLIVFYFMAGMILEKEKDFKTYFWCVFIPLILTILIINFKHAALGFTFESINSVVHPFYRNHVNYACLMALFFPIVWLAVGWYKRWSIPQISLVLGGVLMLIGIYFSYTRAAYVAILLALGAFVVIRLRLMKAALGIAVIAVMLFFAHLYTQNNYLQYAPDYNKTITHKDFGNLLEATAKGEDISTMERVYRWVAGFQMIKKEPLTGFGPGNFINFYEKHTVSNFQTYVSDNPERSGIHSYYFMTMVEQGFPGLFIFLLLIGFVLIKGEQVYHQTKDPAQRKIVLMAILSIVVVDALLLINDMLETDKVGPFFFIGIVLIVNQDLRNQGKLSF